MMTGITGAHILLYSDNPEADRAFFRDVLGFRAVDAGEGWLIFALPPAEAGIHPSDGITGQLHGGRHLLGAVLYLMCDDLAALMKSLQAKNVTCSPVEEAPWGIKTTIQLPSGGELGLHLHLPQPTTRLHNEVIWIAVAPRLGHPKSQVRRLRQKRRLCHLPQPLPRNFLCGAGAPARVCTFLCGADTPVRVWTILLPLL